jgi:hypothetical protein
MRQATSDDLDRVVAVTDSGFGTGTSHTQALLEHLAVAQLTGSASLRAMLDLLQRDGQGALIVVVGHTTGDELAAAGRLRLRYGLVRIVRADTATGGGREPDASGSGVSVVRVGPGSPFPTAWNRAMVARPTGRLAAEGRR